MSREIATFDFFVSFEDDFLKLGILEDIWFFDFPFFE